MPSVSVKNEKNLITVLERSIKAFNFNERELDLFSKSVPDGFFKPVVEKNNRIKYIAPIGIPLEKYIEHSVTEHKMFSIIAGLLSGLIRAEALDLYIGNFVLDDKLIFVDELSGKLYLIYRPLNSREGTGNFYRFIDNLVIKIKEKNPLIVDICDELHLFLTDSSHYKISELINYLEKNYPNIFREFRINDNRKDIKEPKSESVVPDENDDKTCVLVNSNHSIDNSSYDIIKSNTNSIKLISKENNINILVSYYPYIIGKSHERADGVIDGDSMISRTHAQINYKDGKYYIEDLSSANGTFVDDIKLEPGVSTCINSKSVIRLADIKFTVEGINDNTKNTKMFFINSPVSLCSNDNYIPKSYSIAENLAKEYQVLLISADYYQIFDYSEHNISFDTVTLNLIKSEDGRLYENIRGQIIQDKGVDILKSFSSSLGANGVEDFFLYKIAELIKIEGIYDYIIVDDSCSIGKNIETTVDIFDLFVIELPQNKYGEILKNKISTSVTQPQKYVFIKCNTDDNQIVQMIDLLKGVENER